MEIIMKKLTGFVIILAVLILGGYYGMGILTEKTIKKNIEIVNQSNGLTAEILQYDRGFASSDAKVKWRLHVPEGVTRDAAGQTQIIPAQDYQMELPVHIKHGPVFFADNRLRFGMGNAESVIPFPTEYTEQFNNLFTKESVKPQMNLNVFVNYLNQSTINLNVPTFKLIAKDGSGQMNWMGMESSTLITSNVDKVVGDFVIKGIEFSKDTSKMVLSKVSSDYDLHETKTGLMLGNAAFTLSSMVVTDKENKILDLNNLELRSDSDVKTDLFHMNFIMSLKSLFANGQTYGPGDMKLSLRNLDAEMVGKLNAQVQELQNKPEAERQQALLGMIPLLPKLLSKGPALELSTLTLKLPQGMLNGNLLVTLPKSETSNPFELIQKVEGKAKLQLPMAVVKQLMQQSVRQQLANQPIKEEIIKQLQAGQAKAANLPEPTLEELAVMRTDKQLEAMVKAGLIVTKGSDYVIEVTLKQGQFTVNSKPYDPSMMQF
jgi:uncharacterized protein YdgA (DUF945 family)